LGGGNSHHAWCSMPDMDLAPCHEEEDNNEDKCMKETNEVEGEAHQLPYSGVDVKVLL
jgi:hypothetical protein